MATDIIARGIAVSNSGGGGGGTGVEIQSGAGIKLDGSDPVIISNSGVTDVQTGSAEASNGTIRVVIAGKDSESKDVPVKGLADAAYKNVDTTVNESTKNSNDIPTTKAVKEALDKKVDTSKLEDSNGVATLDENKKLKSAQLPSHNHGSNETNAMTGYSKPSTLADKAIKNTDTLNDAIGKLEKSLDDKMDNGNYAGSSTKGGSATSAEKLTNTEQIGTNTKPVYFSADGVPVAIEHTIGSDVPANAKFTDTTYSSGTGIRINDDTIHNMGVLSVSESTTNGCVDVTIGKNGTETSENKTVPVHGLGSAAYKNVDTTVTKDSANLITSGAVASGLADKIDTSKRNAANGVSGLDANKKVDVSQIPTTDMYDTNSAYPVTGKAIEAAMNTLPNPMIYKGSLGTGGTITTLPSATKANEGFTYKVITAGTYSNQSAKIGDVFISNGTEWTIIPSGDEPNGTVTSVGISVPTGLKINDGTSPITTSGTIEILLDDGYVIPKTSDIVPSTRTVNGKALSSNITLNASDVGLGNVGNFKAVSTVASQGLTDAEKSNARTNIGAGTSSLTLGETSSTAYRGDRGKIAYDHTLSAAGTNPHGTTKSDVGLGNVPNVATNNQTPSYTEASSLAKLTSGEKLSVAFGKISKAVTDLISHLTDTVKHITSTERTNWGVAYTHSQSAHAPSSAQANVIETVKVNGTALTPSSKAVNITVPVTTDTYTSTGTAPVSGKAVASAIGGLDVTGASGIGQGKTIKSWSETDGKVSITTQDIKITKSQVSDFPTSMTPTAHNQASSTINAMTSYSKATSSSAITTSDTLNAAVGKLEYKADTNETNILLVENGSYKTHNLTDNIVRLTENKDGYAYITSTAGDVIKSVGKNLINPTKYEDTTGSGHFTTTAASDGSCTIVSDGANWTLNGYVSGKVKIPITKPGTFYFVCEHISGNVYNQNEPTKPAVCGHQLVLLDASGTAVDTATYSEVSFLAETGTVLRTKTITAELIQAGAVTLQIAIWGNGTTSAGYRIYDNYKFRIAAYFDDNSITADTPYQPYKESVETCDASGHCYIMTYEDGSVYSQNDYPTKTITVDYPESDFAARFNESEKATDGIDKSDVNYIEMKSGQRVYADTEEPYGNIEVGSIGVGFDSGLREFGVGAKKSATTFPVTFGTDGTPITNYTIYSNTGGVGDRSVNYVDRMNLDAVGLYPNQTTGTVEAGSGSSYSIIIPVSSLTDCFFSINRETTTWNRCRLAGYATYPEVGTTATFVDGTTGTATDDTSGVYSYNSNAEIPAGTNYIMVFLATAISSISSVDLFREAVKASKPMLTSGTEKLPYVKYYSIPITCNSVTSEISLDAPLATGESVTYEDSGSPIYTVNGQNTMAFGSTVAPAKIEFEYVGWHPTGEIADLIARVEALEAQL